MRTEISCRFWASDQPDPKDLTPFKPRCSLFAEKYLYTTSSVLYSDFNANELHLENYLHFEQRAAL